MPEPKLSMAQWRELARYQDQYAKCSASIVTAEALMRRGLLNRRRVFIHKIETTLASKNNPLLQEFPVNNPRMEVLFWITPAGLTMLQERKKHGGE